MVPLKSSCITTFVTQQKSWDPLGPTVGKLRFAALRGPGNSWICRHHTGPNTVFTSQLWTWNQKVSLHCSIKKNRGDSFKQRTLRYTKFMNRICYATVHMFTDIR